MVSSLPISLFSVTSAQTVTFDSFLANYNNGDRPGGGSGVLNLDSGVFTCFTPGYYTVSFSVSGITGFNYGAQTLHLYKNGKHLTESTWWFGTSDNVEIEVTRSRILVGKSLHESCLLQFLQILHMDAGGTLELRCRGAATSGI